ncbi:MAG: gamma-glutamyltransferase [Anaerolineae bacterium]|nr:MAG: gamma-glutamyltransferase [Anaerolineae bacterium]
MTVKGAIAAGDPATAEAGAQMLRQGGNAVDAAVAAAFASFIAEVGVVHLGGSGVAQIVFPKSDSSPATLSYDFFSAMPGLGRKSGNDKLDFEEVIIDFGPTTQSFYLGRGSVAVPGNIFGLCKMAENHGRLPLSSLLEPAITLAREGHSIAKFQAETCDLLSPLYTHTSSMRDIFFKNGQIIKSGDRLFIPHLEDTLIALADRGEELIRTGPLADSLVNDQLNHGGLITKRDLIEYNVLTPPPIRINYREFEVLLPPPSSSGGVLTAFTLKLLCQLEVAKFTHGSTDHIRLLFEIMGATTRARPILDRALNELSPEQAVEYFLADGFVNHYAGEVNSAIYGDHRFPALSEPSYQPDTSHISVIDASGLAVSLTTTAGESAGYVVPETGFIPNNILGEADLHPAGFHSRTPGQRIPTMMTPTLILKDGNIRLVVGSGGSIRIRSAVLQVLSNLLDYKMKLDAAVNYPRVHLEDGVLQCESGYDAESVDKLETMGYPVNRWDKRSIYFGGAHSVSRTERGHMVAAGDNRRGGAVSVVE